MVKVIIRKIFICHSLFPRPAQPSILPVKEAVSVLSLNKASQPSNSESFKKEPRFKISDTSRSQRIEVLESNMGEMKGELSHTRPHIEQMMGMMQQLLQAKSADGGQQEEKSGGSSRGDANDDSGGAGRHRTNKGPLAQDLVPQQNCCRVKNVQPQQQSVGWIKTCRRDGPETRGSGWRRPDDQHAARRS